MPKLQGAGDYRAWKRSFEIQLSAKRKLGFGDGTVTRSATEAAEACQWNTCNNMVISWIHNNIFDNIKTSVLFINTAVDIWKQLEKRFSLTNGSRKYKLNKDLFGLRQDNMKISEYFTSLSCIWEELESMNTLPIITSVTTEVTNLLKAINDMKEKSKLFQFLNGLNETYNTQRSQLLMMSPLPTVEAACALIQQEESQNEVLTRTGKYEADAMAMFSKGVGERSLMCTACGKRGHTNDKCWTVTGQYPKWHYKYKANPKNSPNKWMGNKTGAVKMANNVQGNVGEQSVVMTSQQLEELLKLIPQGNSAQGKSSETDDELECGFSGMVFSNKGKAAESVEWIIDSEASDHMTSSIESMENVRVAPSTFSITLPTGDTAMIEHVGDIN